MGRMSASATTPPPGPPPVTELEKRLRWRLLPTITFVVALVGLLVLAVLSLVVPKRHPRGLPDDPAVLSAAAELSGRVTVRTDVLRWRSAILGGEPANRPANRDMLERVTLARQRLRAARHPHEARVLAALAALDLATHDYARAIAHYRRACEAAPHYGEGRLGAGVALALEAGLTSDSWRARSLRLQAIAQFAMVDSLDEEYTAALYDRAHVLRDVGREREAGFWARRALAADPGSHWSEGLRREGFLDE